MSVMQIEMKDSDINDNKPKEKVVKEVIEKEKETNIKKVEPKHVFKNEIDSKPVSRYEPEPKPVVATSNTSGNRGGNSLNTIFGGSKK